jgi:hypothetical protein
MARPCDECGRRNFKRTPVIRGELTGSNLCKAVGFTATSAAPVLALCRTVLAAGFDPGQPLEVYRGATLALRVRSIGEAAELELNGDATGFRRRRQPDAAPPIRGNGAGGAETRAKHEARR